MGRLDTYSGVLGRRLRGQHNAEGVCNDEETNFDQVKTHRGFGCIAHEFEGQHSNADLLPVVRIERIHRFSRSSRSPHCGFETQWSERQFIRLQAATL